MTILLIILAVLAIILVAAAFTSKNYFIEKNVIISKPCSEVFNYIKFLKNQDHFNKWVMMDPASKKTYTGTDGTVGFVFAWDSNNKNLGKGEQEIIGIEDGKKVDYEIRFIKPFPSTSFSGIITEEVSAGETKVTWTFKGVKNYMMKLFHMLFNLKKMLGRDLQTSLDNLKAVLEK